ncbi:MAG: hypothetical protein ABW352_24385 [Polyangiales bacterium]
MLALVSRKTRLFVASALVVLGLTSVASAYYWIYPPNTPPAGRPYRTLAADWWKFVLKQPVSSNPLLDTDGSKCRNGQSGGFFFLVGALDDTPVKRTKCTIPIGKTVVFPIVNALYAAFPGDPANERTEAFVKSQVSYVKDATTNLVLEIDGNVVSNPKQYFVQGDAFNFTLPANNIYGLPAGQKFAPAADAGFYIALSQWEPGNHKVRFKGTLDGTTIDVTYELKVNYTPF